MATTTTRADLECALQRAGWTVDDSDDSRYALCNSVIALNPSGDDDDVAVCSAIDFPERRRAVSYAAAAAWASGIITALASRALAVAIVERATTADEANDMIAATTTSPGH